MYEALAAAETVRRPEDVRSRTQDQLAAICAKFRVEADVKVVEGNPASTIASEAETLEAELVIVGTRGRTGLQRVLLGSVAESVVRHAACSVLVVRLDASGGMDDGQHR